MPTRIKRRSDSPAPSATAPSIALQLAESAGIVTKLSPGRLSRDWPQQYPALPVIMPPSDPEGVWEFYHADTRTLRRFSVAELLDLMVDLSPDVSRALWDLLRLCNPSWTCQAFSLTTNKPHSQAQAALDGFFQHLTNMYGAVDVLWNELFTQAFMRGAMWAELVLDADARNPIDIGLPDPLTARFKRELDPIRGPVWVLGQLQLGGFVPMARPTIRYVPIDKVPGKPYGRPMVSPAFFPTLFLMTLLHDLRRVIGQQGYPRIDLTIDLNALTALMPPEVRFSPAKQAKWVDDTINEIKKEYGNLQPDDAFVHTSAMTVGRPVGTVDASSLGGIGAIIAVLERQIVRALKTMPVMMALTDGSSEANANRQWEIQTTGIASLQHPAETMIEALLGLALRAQGIAARVVFRFAVLRAAQALRDAQTHQIELANAAFEYDRGWTAQDEAALKTVGHVAAEPEPRVFPTTDQPAVGEDSGVPAGGPPEPGDQGDISHPANPEPGADRVRELVGAGV